MINSCRILSAMVMAMALVIFGGTYADLAAGVHADKNVRNSLNGTVENNSRPFFFVQVTDIHICDNEGKKILEKLIGREVRIDPESFVKATVQDIADLHPNFVMASGDLVIDARDYSPQEILAIYKLINESMQPIINDGVPFYPLIGNHDVVGVFNKSVDANESGYGKGMFQRIFNQKTTYYSFDKGGYHFVALDPNSYELWNVTTKSSAYQVDKKQMQWLKEDLNSTDRPVIVFLHEPTIDLLNGGELLSVLRAHDTKMIFSGHWHVNDLLNSSGIPEQVTTAVSGAWWTGADSTKTPGGYLVVVPHGSEVDTFYRNTGQIKQINICDPAEPLVKDVLNVRAQIWTKEPLEDVWICIDKGPNHAMNVSWQGLWYEAVSSVDIKNLSIGYHQADVIAADHDSCFSASFSFKLTNETVLPINEILLHPETYLGRHPKIKGYVDGKADLSRIEVGMQPLVRDGTGAIPFVQGKCNLLPGVENKTQWLVSGQLQRYDLNDFSSVFLIYGDGSCPEKTFA